MGIADKFTNSRYQYLYPECAYGGWHQFAPYNELVKEYFCTDGKDIDNSGVYDDNDPYANREIRLYASIFLPPLGSYPGTKYNDITYNCFQGLIRQIVTIVSRCLTVIVPRKVVILP